jgi:hypothetical protein
VRRTLLGAVLAAALAVGPALAGDFDNVRGVALVPMLDNNLMLQTNGMTIFDKSSNGLPTGWDIDGAFARRATAALGGRYQVQVLALPAGTFDDVHEGLFKTRIDLIGERLRAMPRPAGVDVYVLALPIEGLMRDETRGLFVYHDAGLLTGKGTVVSVPYYIYVIDAVSGKRLAAGKGEIPWSGTMSGYGEPSELCADDLWPATPQQLTAVQRGRLHQEVFSLVERSAPFALYDAGLLPEASARTMLSTASAPEPSCHGMG